MDPVIQTGLEQGGTVITANRRLSMELGRQYAYLMLDEGRTVWKTPDILPWGAWVRRSWDRGPGRDPGAPAVLTDSQLHLIWQDLIRTDVGRHHGHESSLWNIETTARTATGTLRLIRQWGIDTATLPPTRHPDHAGFQRWLQAYEQQCLGRNRVDPYRLPDLLAEWPPTREGLCLLAGFDYLTTQQQHLLTQWTQAGAQVATVPLPNCDYQKIPCQVFPTAGDQWNAIAEWTRQCLADDPEGQVAIVVPDLRTCRDDLVSTLTEALAPGQVVHPGDSRELPFHVSLGDPLARHPMGRGLLFLLMLLCTGRSDQEKSEAFLRSPWIAHHHDELLSRSHAALALREALPWEHTLHDLARALDTQDCPLLSTRLDRALSAVAAAPNRAPLSAWSTFISDLLEILGWPGGDLPLNSDQYQAFRSIREQIMELGSLEEVSENCGLLRAVSLLGQLLGSRIFQPEAGAARVQVLGIDEAAGLMFDHIWFANLTEEEWPAPATPTPFVEIAVQREAGCPFVDADSIQQQAEARHRRLAGSTLHLVQSRPEREGDTEQIPSPLVASCPHPEPVAAVVQTLFHRLQPVQSPVHTLVDAKGPRLMAGTASGGTGLIKQQSICPRGAFLRYRLGARTYPMNQPGLDAGQRGSLVHAILASVWGKLQDSKTLAATSHDSLQHLIGDVIDHAAGKYRMASGCGPRFFASQRVWLLDTLMEWFQIERERIVPFTVIGREQSASLNLAGLRLAFRIDRIDRLNNGSLVLIDYKTGSLKSVQDWSDRRPMEPQLPLYALSQGVRGEGHSLAAVAWARIRLGECAMSGILDPTAMDSCPTTLADHPQAKVRPYHHKSPGAEFPDDEFKDLYTQQQDWGQNLEALAAEFLAGEAGINPREQGVCRDCPTPAFCRMPAYRAPEEGAVRT